MGAESSPRSEIMSAAAEWRARLDSDDAGESDWLAYESWLAASAEHRAAADALDATLAEVTDLGADLSAPLAQMEAEGNVSRLADRKRPRAAVWIAAGLGAAACAVLAIALRPPPTQQFAYVASADTDRQETLPDGSTVHLNRGAALSVTYGRDRRVALERGEASFTVVHDPQRPFEVAAGDATIRDVGTEFNVARNAQSIVVTVRSGEVSVATAAAAATLVGAGAQARVAAGRIAVQPVEASDAFAWQSGQLVYHDAPLAAVVEDLNRYSATAIVLASPELGALRFSGALAIDSTEAMLARLRAFLPIRTRQEGDRIVVRSAA